MGTLYLIRHGQASYGQTDYDKLSARGVEQARAVGAWLAGKVDATFAGPLRRQQQTIEYARETDGIAAPTTVPELAEYPAFEMLQHFVPRLAGVDPEFAALRDAPTPRLLDKAFQTVLAKWSTGEWSASEVETAIAFVERVRTGLDRIVRAAASGARIAAVTSAGPIGVALGLVFGLPAERMIRTSIAIRNASISELRFRSNGFDWQPDKVTLVTFNTTGHLPAELNTER